MRGDLYRARLKSLRELTYEQAIQAALDQGLIWSNFSWVRDGGFGQSRWLDLWLEIDTIHSDVSAHGGPTFLLRILDSGVCASDNPHPITWEGSPLRARHPQLWSDAHRHGQPTPEMILILHAQIHPLPRPSDWTRGACERLTARCVVPQELVPNLAQGQAWTSRAWDGPCSWGTMVQRGARQTDLRPLWPTRVYHSSWLRRWPRRDGVSETTYHRFNFFGGLGFAGLPGGEVLQQALHLYRIQPSGDHEVINAPLTRAKSPKVVSVWSGSTDANGALWLATRSGLAKHLGGISWDLITKQEGLPSDEVRTLAWRDGQPVLATKAGVAIRQDDGTWTCFGKGLQDKDCKRVAVDDEGAIWALGAKGLSKIDRSGAITKFGRAQGMLGGHSLLLLPGGAILVANWEGLHLLAPGAKRFAPLAWLREALPGSCSALALGHDGVVWALHQGARLLRLCVGEEPRLYAFQDPFFVYPNPQAAPGAYHEYASALAASPAGLWISANGLIFIDNEALAQADAAPSINPEPATKALVPPWPTR